MEFVYKNVKVPKPLWNECEKLIEVKGYASDSELIREALRRIVKENEYLLGERGEKP